MKSFHYWWSSEGTSDEGSFSEGASSEVALPLTLTCTTLFTSSSFQNSPVRDANPTWRGRGPLIAHALACNFLIKQEDISLLSQPQESYDLHEFSQKNVHLFSDCKNHNGDDIEKDEPRQGSVRPFACIIRY